MPQFQYKGRGRRGDRIEGRIEASNADAVATQLFNSGVTPIEIFEIAQGDDVLESFRQRFLLSKPTLIDLVLFSRQMYTLMKAGVPIIRAMNGLADSTRNPILARTLSQVVDHLESGRDLASALSQFPDIFSTLFVSMVQVGENTGRLDEAFDQLSIYLEQEKATRDRIKSALRYPSIVMVGIAIAIAIINVKVIPAFAGVFKSFKAELPWATKLLINTSEFSVAYWPYILGALILTWLGVRSYVQTEPGRYRWDKLKLRLPLVGGIIHRATLSRYARSFAMATRAGVPLIQGLTVVSKAVDNAFVADRLLIMRNGIERGDTLTRTAAATGLFTPLVLQMLSVGEETGGVDDMLVEVADFYEREVDYDLRKLGDAIEPLIIVAVGVMVLVLALGVFLPMWELSGAAQGRG
jgi:MSHA biogenesis protein MshG